MPRQQKTNNVTTTIGTTTFVDKVSTYKVNNNTRSLETEEALEYNWLGNITKYGNVRYFYDRLGRLTREDNPAIDKTITWMYNSDNSPTQRVVYPYTTGTLGDPVDTWTFTYGTACREQITGFNGQTITYGRAGEAINYRNMRFSWIRGKLLGTIKATDLTLTLTYNGEGLRDGKDVTTTNGTKHHSYYYADGHLVCETCKDVPDTGVNFIVQYFYNQQGIVAMCYGGSHYMFRKNFFGDIIGIYDWENNCVAKYAYDAYGVCKVMNPDGTENTDEEFIGNVNPIRYRGYYYDVGTGFYYLQTRYYDPQIGRFISAGDVEHLNTLPAGEPNLYAYCRCNPVAKKISDPIDLGIGEPTVFEEPSTPTGRHDRATGNVGLPNIDHVSRITKSASIVKNKTFGKYILDCTLSLTTQDKSVSGLYTISTTGDGWVGSGIGFSPWDWFSVEYNTSSEGILTKTVQIGRFSFTAGIGTNGVSIGIGYTNDKETFDVTTNFGGIVLALCWAASSVDGLIYTFSTAAKNACAWLMKLVGAI